jgi:hypothetical protein
MNQRRMAGCSSSSSVECPLTVHGAGLGMNISEEERFRDTVICHLAFGER